MCSLWSGNGFSQIYFFQWSGILFLCECDRGDLGFVAKIPVFAF